ncbi:MAG: hypothetical protein A3D24_04725 [Candidatus Blackburnbacteria bacterium RIFCSPHIGHO2_02_FULL_39_13]|uniref:NIF system FeS cluster assembly NifU N-terminal domain-containing protein n=1 Tax=Candidatus Blackburnbacteria bacterium RIFCSPLOWO2_01_FULL_40_20 TaxID=1797519 RepID=A0A1G1VBE1_9BACT|nr:MAG: SUF system FeS assembly protein, NifU family [Microgenomates group bacterium GW2011_GWA2_39_19]OGY07094.1 MAG: hypothetical protein A2694_03395 [Candidatus Blackburnbacteria bacterium RIFCSPHIGHO2_01_FULL_40_17]OGY08916.1 MAG: hypothetical protein A3D24_04725 [Candidatus Blackburnbacteria bacterium RIFCSPHIGHO2_02_FULL_39_13]OGY12738.1 MAG: hypothetical protein A3A77_00420 [Candidatus Blackburnbacteria bacterium RIFCSPLOWO2_01_FULL_40_20]OGY15281.1 MAG: hypothetical protein A3I52_01080 
MDLYKELLIDHWKNPRNFKRLKRATSRVKLVNPLCGDKMTLELKVENGEIADVGFSGTGCIISQAAGSLLTEEVRKLKKLDKICKIDEKEYFKILGTNVVPGRKKCALLAYQALKKALEGNGRQNT